MRDSLMPGLEGVDQYPGHLEAQISLHLIFSCGGGYIKNTVYGEKIRNIQHLKDRITSAIATVTRDMIQKTWQEIEFRLDVSKATNGAHIEMYQGKSRTLNFSGHFKMRTCKSVKYFLSYSGFKSRPSFSMTLYKRLSGHLACSGRF